MFPGNAYCLGNVFVILKKPGARPGLAPYEERFWPLIIESVPQIIGPITLG